MNYNPWCWQNPSSPYNNYANTPPRINPTFPWPAQHFSSPYSPTHNPLLTINFQENCDKWHRNFRNILGNIYRKLYGDKDSSSPSVHRLLRGSFHEWIYLGGGFVHNGNIIYQPTPEIMNLLADVIARIQDIGSWCNNGILLKKQQQPPADDPAFNNLRNEANESQETSVQEGMDITIQQKDKISDSVTRILGDGGKSNTDNGKISNSFENTPLYSTPSTHRSLNGTKKSLPPTINHSESGTKKNLTNEETSPAVVEVLKGKDLAGTNGVQYPESHTRNTRDDEKISKASTYVTSMIPGRKIEVSRPIGIKISDANEIGFPIRRILSYCKIKDKIIVGQFITHINGARVLPSMTPRDFVEMAGRKGKTCTLTIQDQSGCICMVESSCANQHGEKDNICSRISPTASHRNNSLEVHRDQMISTHLRVVKDSNKSMDLEESRAVEFRPNNNSTRVQNKTCRGKVDTSDAQLSQSLPTSTEEPTDTKMDLSQRLRMEIDCDGKQTSAVNPEVDMEAQASCITTTALPKNMTENCNTDIATDLVTGKRGTYSPSPSILDDQSDSTWNNHNQLSTSEDIQINNTPHDTKRSPGLIECQSSSTAAAHEATGCLSSTTSFPPNVSVVDDDKELASKPIAKRCGQHFPSPPITTSFEVSDLSCNDQLSNSTLEKEKSNTSTNNPIWNPEVSESVSSSITTSSERDEFLSSKASALPCVGECLSSSATVRSEVVECLNSLTSSQNPEDLNMDAPNESKINISSNNADQLSHIPDPSKGSPAFDESLYTYRMLDAAVRKSEMICKRAEEREKARIDEIAARIFQSDSEDEDKEGRIRSMSSKCPNCSKVFFSDTLFCKHLSEYICTSPFTLFSHMHVVCSNLLLSFTWHYRKQTVWDER